MSRWSVFRTVVIGVLAFFLTFPPSALARTQGGMKAVGSNYRTAANELEIRPGKIVDMRFLCDGEQPYARFTWTYTLFDDGAGHRHSGGQRPWGKTSVSSARVRCDGRLHKIGKYTAPEIAGTVRINIYINGAPATQPSFYFKVRERGLERLPRSNNIDEIGFSAFYGFRPLTGCVAKQNHPQNHWGKPQLNAKILQLAAAFKAERSKNLKVNDMSLRYGGRFDVCDNWTDPHETHMDGRHVDIRYWNMDAADRTAFRRIARRIFGSRNVCVDGPIKHWHLSIGTPSNCTISR